MCQQHHFRLRPCIECLCIYVWMDEPCLYFCHRYTGTGTLWNLSSVFNPSWFVPLWVRPAAAGSRQAPGDRLPRCCCCLSSVVAPLPLQRNRHFLVLYFWTKETFSISISSHRIVSYCIAVNEPVLFMYCIANRVSNHCIILLTLHGCHRYNWSFKIGLMFMFFSFLCSRKSVKLHSGVQDAGGMQHVQLLINKWQYQISA